MSGSIEMLNPTSMKVTLLTSKPTLGLTEPALLALFRPAFDRCAYLLRQPDESGRQDGDGRKGLRIDGHRAGGDNEIFDLADDGHIFDFFAKFYNDVFFFFFEAINSDNIYLRACLFTFSNKMWREKCVERETRHIPSMNFQMQVSFFQCSKGEKKSCHKLIVSMNCCRNFETDAIWGHHQNSLCRVFAEVLLFGINV